MACPNGYRSVVDDGYYRHQCMICGTISDITSTSEAYCHTCKEIYKMEVNMERIEVYRLATIAHESGKALYIPDYSVEAHCKFHGHKLVNGKCTEPILSEPHELDVIQRLSEAYRELCLS